MPRNVGLSFACGEYILFMDSDDAITPTALEELYPIAKKFDADVVYCEKSYLVELGDQFTTKKDSLKVCIDGGSKDPTIAKFDLVTEPTLVSEDSAERIKDVAYLKFLCTPWNYLIRRELISKHDLKFPNVKYGEDNFWDLYVVCLAKNIVRVPNIVYIKRMVDDSIMTSATPEDQARRYIDHCLKGVSIINKFAEKFPPLKENPELRYKLFERMDLRIGPAFLEYYSQISACYMELFVLKYLDEVDDKSAVIAVLLGLLNTCKLHLGQYKDVLKKFLKKFNDKEREIQKLAETIQTQAIKIKILERQVEELK